MSPEVDVDSLPFVQRLTLLAVAEAAEDGVDPVDSRTLRKRCQVLLEPLDAPVVSEPAERDVMRALSALGAEPYVAEEQSQQSPTGKGRPQYGLSTAPDAVLDALAEDEQLAPAVERVRE